ncbi:MAG TPA: hypothetical protein VEU33_26560 [Archangium sp.]|nr:hypothetical protein [Archangium sp.]
MRRARELLEARWDQNVSLDELALHSGWSVGMTLAELWWTWGVSGA